MGDALKAAWSQVVKDADKLPGWVPLFVVILLAVDSVSSERFSLWSGELPLLLWLLAGALTLLLYIAGDALDEVVFKTGPKGARETRPLFKKMYCAKLKSASNRMGVGSGVYSVALKLVAAGEGPLGRLVIHFPNEAAKFLRAFILPLSVVAIFLVPEGHLGRAAICVAGALLLFPVYLMLKVLHLRRLYSAASLLSQDADHCNREPLGPVCLVFWDGALVGSGRSVAASRGTNTV